MKLNIVNHPEFKCSQCGMCCTHIRGMLPREDREFVKEMAYGKLPLVQLIPVDEMSFPLWDWEAARFKQWALERDVTVRIAPSRGVLDLQSNTAIFVTYYIDSDACPFLHQGKCKIYDKERAYVCRLFPFNRGPFLDVGSKATRENMFGTCGAMESLLPLIPEKKESMIPFLAKAFPDGSFENAVQFDYITEWVNRTIIDLMRKKKLRPAMNKPYPEFMKLFQSAKKMDFSDFLEQQGYISSKDDLIGRFDQNEDARELLREYTL